MQLPGNCTNVVEGSSATLVAVDNTYDKSFGKMSRKFEDSLCAYPKPMYPNTPTKAYNIPVVANLTRDKDKDNDKNKKHNKK